MYSGTTADSQLRSIDDELTSFFTACHHRALMRKTPVRIFYQNNTLGIEQSSSLRLRIPELAPESGKMINGMVLNDRSARLADGTSLERLQLNVFLPGKRLATLTLEL